jgi:hypothetical protein
VGLGAGGYRGRGVDLSEFIRKLPAGATVPPELSHGDLVLRAITRADLADDVRGINESLEIIRRTRGGGWPTEPVTEEGNYTDLVWHELEWRDGASFTYVVRDRAGSYLGCAYLYPMGRRTPLNDALLDHDVDVSWWVTPEAYARGDYDALYHALRHWLATELPFTAPFFSNAEIPESRPA